MAAITSAVTSVEFVNIERLTDVKVSMKEPTPVPRAVAVDVASANAKGIESAVIAPVKPIPRNRPTFFFDLFIL